MYCTGGIRCDVYSAALRQKGFKNLFTLHGGIQNYLHEEGNEHWQGSLFVFDGRMAINPALQQGNEGKETALVASSTRGYRSAHSDVQEQGVHACVVRREPLLAWQGICYSDSLCALFVPCCVVQVCLYQQPSPVSCVVLRPPCPTSTVQTWTAMSSSSPAQPAKQGASGPGGVSAC